MTNQNADDHVEDGGDDRLNHRHHDHDREESHQGHGRDYGHSHRAGSVDERRIGWAFVIIFGFMLVEVAGGSSPAHWLGWPMPATWYRTPLRSA
jgi:hypothetical protein